MTSRMMPCIVTIILISISFLSISAQSETLRPAAFKNVFHPEKEAQYKLKELLKEEDKLVRVSFKTLYWAYKRFLSSQDAQSCSFHPSCSTYSLEAIQKRGILGLLYGFDRLTRCNSLSPEKYPVHPETKRLYDPFE